MAAHGMPSRLCPAHHSSLSAPSPRSAVRAAATSDSVRACAEDRPGGRSRNAGVPGQPPPFGMWPRQGLFELPPGERLAPPVVADRARRLASQRDRVLDAGQRRPDRKRLVDHLVTGVRQREQVAGEIAAVDRRARRPARAGAGRACRTSCTGGHGTVRVRRRSRASPPGAPPSRGSRSTENREPSRSPADTARCSSARCDSVRRAAGFVLEVVGRQAMVLRRDEGLEKCQVRRAISRTARTSAAASCSGGGGGGGAPLLLLFFCLTSTYCC